MEAAARNDERPERHSPGPWSVGEDVHRDTAIVDGSGIMLVGVVKRWHTMNADEWKYNARLIAAAPELLDALRYVCGATVHTNNRGHMTELPKALDFANGLIRKLDGGL